MEDRQCSGACSEFALKDQIKRGNIHGIQRIRPCPQISLVSSSQDSRPPEAENSRPARIGTLTPTVFARRFL
jgi:hypothetical protein